MNCNCKWTETVIGLVILVLAIWPSFLGSANRWVTLIAAALLILHAWRCSNCGHCMPETSRRRKRR